MSITYHSCRNRVQLLSYLEYNLPEHSCRVWNITYQDILVVLPGHEDQPLALHQLCVVDQAQAFRGILSVGLNKGTLSRDFSKYILIYLWKKVHSHEIFKIYFDLFVKKGHSHKIIKIYFDLFVKKGHSHQIFKIYFDLFVKKGKLSRDF